MRSAIIICIVLFLASTGGAALAQRLTVRQCEQVGAMVGAIAQMRDSGVSEDDAVARMHQVAQGSEDPEAVGSYLTKVVEAIYSRRGISPESLRDDTVNECKENVSDSD
jgi:hypothetical protein